MNIADTLRKEIGRAESIKQVAVGAGLPYSSLYNFYRDDADLQLSNVQKLASYFGYRLVKSRPRPAKKRG